MKHLCAVSQHKEMKRPFNFFVLTHSINGLWQAQVFDNWIVFQIWEVKWASFLYRQSTWLLKLQAAVNKTKLTDEEKKKRCKRETGFMFFWKQSREVFFSIFIVTKFIIILYSTAVLPRQEFFKSFISNRSLKTYVNNSILTPEKKNSYTQHI